MKNRGFKRTEDLHIHISLPVRRVRTVRKVCMRLFEKSFWNFIQVLNKYNPLQVTFFYPPEK